MNEVLTWGVTEAGHSALEERAHLRKAVLGGAPSTPRMVLPPARVEAVPGGM